jgi:hypothetical protein
MRASELEQARIKVDDLYMRIQDEKAKQTNERKRVAELHAQVEAKHMEASELVASMVGLCARVENTFVKESTTKHCQCAK